MNPMPPLSHALPALALAVSALPVLASTDTLYSHDFREEGWDGYFTAVVDDHLYYDSFQLTGDARIESVSWYGMGLEEIFGVPLVHPSAYRINIHADTGGNAPGALLSSSTIGNFGNITDTGIRLEGIISVFRMNGTLDIPFQATAGTQYWISITDPTDYRIWYWGAGQGGNGTARFIIEGEHGEVPHDLSFTLHGVSAVPEPATAALWLLGAAALAGARRLSQSLSTRSAPRRSV